MSDSDKTSSLSSLQTNERRGTGKNVIIPKEQLTAFERWELASFDRHSPGNHPDPANSTYVPSSDEDHMRQKEHDDIYSLKRHEGYAAGMLQAQADIRQIDTLLLNLQDGLNQIDKQVAQSLLDLSMQVARQMVRETLQIKPEIILKVISEAISSLPHFNQNAHLILHPDDAELVRTQMGEQLSHANWKIITDPNIQRGGCRVETSHSNVDATNEARWRQIVASIGQDLPWRP